MIVRAETSEQMLECAVHVLRLAEAERDAVIDEWLKQCLWVHDCWINSSNGMDRIDSLSIKTFSRPFRCFLPFLLLGERANTLAARIREILRGGAPTGSHDPMAFDPSRTDWRAIDEALALWPLSEGWNHQVVLAKLRARLANPDYDKVIDIVERHSVARD